MSGGKHTIVLIQYTSNLQTRSYIDFPSVGAAMDALVKMYEHKLKELNPSLQHITYDISDLYKYLGTTAIATIPSTSYYYYYSLLLLILLLLFI